MRRKAGAPHEIGVAARLASVIIVASTILTVSRYASAANKLPPPSEHPTVYECRKAASPLTIDGKLDEPAWKAAAWTEVFNRHCEEATHKVRAKLLWDDKYLYIACLAEDTQIFAAKKGRDLTAEVFKGDVFEVFINANKDMQHFFEINYGVGDTFNDYEIVVFPKQDPHFTSQAGGKEFGVLWVPGFDFKNYKAAAHIQGTPNKEDDKDQFWSVEIALPLEEILYSPGMMSKAGWGPAVAPAHGEEWRVNLCAHDKLNKKNKRGQRIGEWLSWARYDPPEGWFHRPWCFNVVRFVHPQKAAKKE